MDISKIISDSFDKSIKEIASGKNNQKYMDTFVINPDADSDLIHARSCTKDKELSAISYTLQEIAERLL